MEHSYNPAFLPLSLQMGQNGNHSNSLLARCLNEANIKNFNIRFIPSADGYEAGGLFFAYQLVHLRRVVEWVDHEAQENVTFKFLEAEQIKGFAIERTPLNAIYSNQNSIDHETNATAIVQ